ncbi:glycerol kinase GlpK [Leeia oryzae]|uniref:glycerol kinase GlpK n=1 Tax=Leeia oryzae TaxID=356662 RepID=UPI0003769FE6|nr:glycerol kinase GlpK [Leeia oryzae]
MPYLLSLDQGTTSSRALIFDETGQIVALAQHEFPQLFPQSGWVEHDPWAIWHTQLTSLRQALEQARLTLADIAAIGITNQRETTLVWDRQTGQPVYNAIVWQDRRTAAHCDQLKAQGLEADFHARTGLLLDPYFSGTKLAWILDHVPGARQQAEAGKLAFGTVDSWLIWQLTEGRVHVTDPSNASRTLLFNIHTGQWDETLLAHLHIPASLLPAVQPSSSLFGHTDASQFGHACPITGVAGDQQAALFGQACHQPGMVKNTYGTGCFMLMQTGADAKASQHGLLTTRAAQTGPDAAYALEGSVFVGGAVIQWLRDGLEMIPTAGAVEALAASVPDSDGVIFVPAFTGLGAPYWDPYARGGVLGLHRGTTKAHIARAALESIAFQSAELLLAMQNDAGQTVTSLRVDGGATANTLLLQLQADLCGLPVIRPKILETTALGAAYLAGLTVGIWDNTDQIARQWQTDRVFEPAISADQAGQRMARWQQAVQRVMHWA